ncbi:hypothetical protein GSI_04792 [Ganoderma sinense ZZ0214-1]|uniref:Fe2OG dioxygenase domain-containing protein n=1 Tax=Ganoderma sinense ZZ0214-1 TaxID=1077348 RepID=A0A2G8SHW4_9APHY|nr:hypothetical protein GSI_04792 [Ganoderma sinense ZZ0214-1]
MPKYKYTAFPLVKRLRTVLLSDPPYCSGVLEVSPSNFELYYGRKDARFVDLLEASTSNDPHALEELAQSCERAIFGRGDEAVLDQTYRKAGKMDSSHFKTGLDLANTGLLDAVRLSLLPDAVETRTVRAELYRLNVYGEGAFFKSHKDTPRSQSMFGSLVIIFPTPHEGGALILRHEDKEVTFDAAALLAGRTSSIAYIAFFGDVEHEVTPIVSGHRVTITYNLSYGSVRKPAPPPLNLETLQPPHASALAVRDALSSLLDDATFLPQGGTLGSGLRHTYPLPYVCTRGRDDPLDSLEGWLKGSDALLFRTCGALGVRPLLRLVSERTDSEVMLDRMVEFSGFDISDTETELRTYEGAVVLRSFGFTGNRRKPWARTTARGYEEELSVHWVTRGGFGEGPCSPYAAYGNEPWLGWLYMRVCLIVKIGPYGRRSEEGEDMGDEEGVADEDEDEEDGKGEGESDDAPSDAEN